jgi:hypothetical protein
MRIHVFHPDYGEAGFTPPRLWPQIRPRGLAFFPTLFPVRPGAPMATSFQDGSTHGHGVDCQKED